MESIEMLGDEAQYHIGLRPHNEAGLILGLRPTNERRRYKVTPSLIGWAQTYNQSWWGGDCTKLRVPGEISVNDNFLLTRVALSSHYPPMLE